jgi:hypothetical protein
LSVDDRESGNNFRNSPTGPWVAPPRTQNRVFQGSQPPLRQPMRRYWLWRHAVFFLIVLGVLIRAYRDMSRPEAWAYWKDQYLSPSLSAEKIAGVDIDGSGHTRGALVVSGKIGAAAATWLHQKLDETQLAAGDIVLLSSPGGDLNQAIIMGEIIRARGLATAVGVADSKGEVRPAYCASACVMVFAGGKPRFGVKGSMLGVHRFVTTTPVHDPVAEAQRVSGMVLGYMTKMGVSSSVVEAMSQTRDVRWLGNQEALAMNLITDPVRTP